MSYVLKSVLVTNALTTDKLKQQISNFAYAHDIDLILQDEISFLASTPSADNHVICVLNIDNAQSYLELAAEHQFSLGVIPEKLKSRIAEWLRLPGEINEALALAFSTDHQAIEVLRCNSEMALGMVTLGSNPFIDGRSKVYENRDHSLSEYWLFKLALVWSSILSLFKIHPFQAVLTVGDAAPLQTAITGLVAIENDIKGPAARLLSSHLSMVNGFINAVVIAPKSTSEYLSFLIDGLFYKERSLAKLPDAITFLRCQEFTLELKNEVDYLVDGRKRSAKEIHICVVPEALKMNVLPLPQEQAREFKAVTKTDNLPRGEELLKMISEALPLFTHAPESDFKDLFIQLREMARPHSAFVMLMVLSAVVASLGLFLSSPAVIIGAMVLALLMSPIISLAMGFLRRDRGILVQSLQTIGLGVGLALLTSALVTLMIPFERITGEMAGRLQPNLLDLGVAIASGIAGAYAYVRADVAKSVSGVAIAVALVPPLCVSGIGLGWMDWQVISGAMLLFLTNLVGISLSAALTFLVLGYAPIVRARKGLAFSSVLMIIIAIPLTVSLIDMTNQWQLEKELSSLDIDINDKEVHLSDLYVRVQSDMTVVHADVLAKEELNREELQQLKDILEREAGQKLRLYLTPRLVL